MSAHPAARRLPAPRVLILGIQHLIVMYTGCVTVPLVFGSALGLSTETIGVLVNADLLVAGLVTVIQALGISRILGVRLPIVAGASFTAVTPMILIGQQYGLQAVWGAMIAAGLFGVLIAVPFSRITRFFPPAVRGAAVTIIGLSLIGTAIGMITDGASSIGGRLALAGAVIALIVVLMRFGRGFLAQAAVLIALLAGTAVAGALSMADFSSVAGAAWFGLPQPFHFGAPTFPIAAVISMCIVMLVIFTESTAYMMSVAEMSGQRLRSGDVARGLAADGLSGVLGGVFTSFPDTVFAQNVSLLQMTGVRSRRVVTVTGVLLVVMGLLPKLGEAVASLPTVVVGAVSLVMFATVAGVGITTLSTVRYEGTQNMLIVSLSLGIGMVPVVAPDLYSTFPTTVQIIAGGAITSCVIVAFVLNLLFNARGQQAHPAPVPAQAAAAPALESLEGQR
ncbi:nucleobase:cation symporter-2 family protein [Kineococcus sp. SYSU DK006]|uniref:nucleobase:cation symporter-2 family protein n=1 Tax=Kineococcus sp. SYSU DK006 TaxID=3383127 RepID=UPI003D7C9A3D